MNSHNRIVVTGSEPSLPVELSPVADLLRRIRPEWQARRLVHRVISLLPVDPSSACQRLLNAAIGDLRGKIVVAGIDLAGEAAQIHGLPPVTRADDVLENYSTTNTLNLAYRMGLLTRPEWRRLTRAYDIRRDLEHEDDEYEAQLEDCLYIFKACIEIVLSKDPIELIRIGDVKAVIESAGKLSFTPDLLEDFRRAPEVRQTEIVRMLVGVARTSSQADVVRQNAVEALRNLGPLTMDKVRITIAADIHEGLKSQPLGPTEMKIAAAAGVVPYLKQRRVAAFFEDVVSQFKRISPDWTDYPHHGDLLHMIEDYGGLDAIPAEQAEFIVGWMVACYLGERGGYGDFGRNRLVFYSNVAAPIIERLFKSAGGKVREALERIASHRNVAAAVGYKPIARRLENLRDLIEGRD